MGRTERSTSSDDRAEGMETEPTEPRWAVAIFAVVMALATLVIVAAVATRGF